MTTFEVQGEVLRVLQTPRTGLIMFMGIVGLVVGVTCVPLALIAVVVAASGGEAPMAWWKVALSIVLLVPWFILMLKSWRSAEYVFDKSTGVLTTSRRMIVGKDQRATYPFAGIAKLRLSGLFSGAKLVSLSVCMREGKPVYLMLEGAFPEAKREAQAVAEAVRSFVGVVVRNYQSGPRHGFSAP